MIGNQGAGAVAILGDTLYAIGGLVNHWFSAINTVRHKRLDEANWASDSFAYPETVYGHAAVTLEDGMTALVMGGVDPSGVTVMDKVYLFDPSAVQKFTPKAPMLTATHSMAAGFITLGNGTKVIVVAGGEININQNCVAQTALYHIDSDTWHSDDSMDLPVTAAYPWHGAVYENALYVTGGYCIWTPTSIAALYAFNLNGVDLVWTYLGEMSSPTLGAPAYHYISAFEHQSRILYYH